MIRNLISRLWMMPHDAVPTWKPRHRVRVALVAATDHAGATEYWSPTAELARVADDLPPEETATEAAEREADEVARHWAGLEQTAAEQTAAELDALGPTLSPLFAALDDAYAWAMSKLGLTPAEIDVMSARARALHETTTSMPIIEAVSA